MLKKVLYILGVLWLVLLLAAGIGAAYLASRGTLTRRNLTAAVAALTSQPVQAAATQPAATTQAGPGPASEVLAAGREAEQAALSKLEILRRQLANEKAMLEAGRLSLLRERETFQQERRQWDADRQKHLETAQLDGMKKELEYLSNIRAAQALALLRAKSDADTAQILMAMETRKGRKIIESCKTDDERKWLGRILELIRQQSDQQAAALAGG